MIKKVIKFLYDVLGMPYYAVIKAIKVVIASVKYAVKYIIKFIRKRSQTFKERGKGFYVQEI